MTATPIRKTKLMTTADLAELIGVTEKTIERWRKSGEGPPFMPFARTIRYHPARVQAWMLAREQGTPAPARGTPAGKGGTRGR